jgi:hypothetical protein
MNVAYGSKLLAENYHYVHPFLYLSWSQKVQNSLNPEHKLTLDTILKKSTDLCKPVRWKLFDILVVTIFWIVSADSYDFIIFLSLPFRLKQSASARSKDLGSGQQKKFLSMLWTHCMLWKIIRHPFMSKKEPPLQCVVS